MDNITKQDRIRRRTSRCRLQASEETPCCTTLQPSCSTVFPSPRPRNDGHGGSTFLHALNGKAGYWAQAEAFAKGLRRLRRLTSATRVRPSLAIDNDADLRVDELADASVAANAR